MVGMATFIYECLPIFLAFFLVPTIECLLPRVMFNSSSQVIMGQLHLHKQWIYCCGWHQIVVKTFMKTDITPYFYVFFRCDTKKESSCLHIMKVSHQQDENRSCSWAMRCCRDDSYASVSVTTHLFKKDCLLVDGFQHFFNAVLYKQSKDISGSLALLCTFD